MLNAWVAFALMLAEPLNMQLIPSGEYRPLYLQEDSPKVHVEEFYIDVVPVTNGQFLQFIASDPRWQAKTIATIFAEPQYLQHWAGVSPKHQPSQAQFNSPVTHVSWFAANAYCRAIGKRLPSVLEWERVASASDTLADGSKDAEYLNRILHWYSLPTQSQLAHVGSKAANFWGVKDMHGLIWEWTHDFNSALVTGDSRGDNNLDQKLFCAAGAEGAADPSNYAAFMRFGFRSSLQARFTLANLGFRCALSKGDKQ